MSDIPHTKHGDKLVKNPSMEQRGILVEEELKSDGMCSPRDRSLNPQIVWEGTNQGKVAERRGPTSPSPALSGG